MLKIDQSRQYVSLVNSESVLLVAPLGLFPPQSGSSFRTVSIAKNLARYFAEVVIYEWDGDHYYVFTSGGMVKIPLLKVRERHFESANQLLSDIGVPRSEWTLYRAAVDNSNLGSILTIAKSHKVKCIQMEFPACAKSLAVVSRNLGIPLLYASHNIECLRMQDLYPNLTAEEIGWFQGIDRLAIASSHAVAVVSEAEIDQLAQLFGGTAAYVLRNGLDDVSESEEPAADLRQLFDLPERSFLIVFHGELNYPPNRDALAIICQQILPRLVARGLDCYLVAFGKGSENFPDHPRLCTIGTVSNPSSIIRAADIAIVPLSSGRGTRIKILEYFQAGLPVVASTKAIEGLAVVDGRHLRVTDSIEEMANLAESILLGELDSVMMRHNASEFAKANSWRSIVEAAMGEIYLPLLASKM